MRSPAATFDLRATLAEEIRGALAELDAPAPRPKDVHRCRVHLKRARALARVGRNCAPGLAAVFNDSARSVMRGLAQERDLTALSEAARAIAKKSPKKARPGLISTADALDAQRAALPPLDLEGARAGLRDLLALAQVWPDASARQIQKGAERIARRARCAFKRGKGKGAAPRRHEWRKREKDRFYAVSLLNGTWPSDRHRRRKHGEKLGEALGRERDALLLIDRIEMDYGLAGDAKHATRALSALTKRRNKLGKRADRIGRKLHAGRA